MWNYLSFDGVPTPYTYYPLSIPQYVNGAPTTTTNTFMMYTQRKEHSTIGSHGFTGNPGQEIFFYPSNQLPGSPIQENESIRHSYASTSSVNQVQSQNEVVHTSFTTNTRVSAKNDEGILLPRGDVVQASASTSRNNTTDATTNQQSQINDVSTIRKGPVKMDEKTWKVYLNSFLSYSEEQLKEIHKNDGEEVWSCTCGKVASTAPVRKNQECLVHFDVFKDDKSEDIVNTEKVKRDTRDADWTIVNSLFHFYT